MVITFLIIFILVVIIADVVIDFNDDLIKLKKYKPKINIILINGLIIISATIVYMMSQNKYDIDKNGTVDFNDVIALKIYVNKNTSN